MAPVAEAAPISISIARDGNQASISLRGTADRSNISRIVDVLDKLAHEDQGCVSLDLQHVESMDLAALEGLASSVGVFKGRKKRMRLKRVSAPVSDLLDRHHCSEMFCCHNECGDHGNCRAATRTWEMDVFSYPSMIQNCKQARERIDKVAESVGVSKCRRADIMLAVGEALTNAVKYGRNQNDEDPHFTVSCIATSEKLCVSISDNGPGFCIDNIPSFEEALFAESGRGVHCMNAVMDEVSFNFQKGTTVRMVKYAG